MIEDSDHRSTNLNLACAGPPTSAMQSFVALLSEKIDNQVGVK